MLGSKGSKGANEVFIIAVASRMSPELDTLFVQESIERVLGSEIIIP